MEFPKRKIYSVSELTKEVKQLLETEFPTVWVEGEISNFRPAPSGHFYFTLKDESSQIRCAMFRTQNQFVRFRIEDGLSVIAWGRLSVYGQRGEYQLILDTMEPVGKGSLMLAFEQLKSLLAAEGLFDAARKRPIPQFPETVGLVTSRRGAAVRDMIRTAQRRSPSASILLSSASVQGDQAPGEILAALDRLCAVGNVDVIVIGRGGGSIEDLWAFNAEEVVRAVAACPIPIVSAVGHETDFTLTDFAADLRASTPTAAIEMILPDRRELLDRVTELSIRLRNAVKAVLRERKTSVKELLKRLYDPRRRIQEKSRQLDEIALRLQMAMRRRLKLLNDQAAATAQRLRVEHLRRRISDERLRCAALSDRMKRAARENLGEIRSEAQTLTSRLEGLSPLAVLSRGYSIAIAERTGEVVRDATRVKTGDRLRVRVHKGEIECSVTATKPEPAVLEVDALSEEVNGE